MDQLQTRLDALEQQMPTITRRLRWWRGLACGAVVLAVLTWALPAGTAPKPQKEKKKDLEERVAALEDLLQHFSRDGNEVFITGANLHIRNGLGSTETTNERGNLIVGYNEPREPSDGEDVNVRTGSHNVVIGQRHNFIRFGGLVVGDFNEIRGDFASVSGGRVNRASGAFASVSGGQINEASGVASAVSGGGQNTASNEISAVSGGFGNTASGEHAAVSGGQRNTASGAGSSVSGGIFNTASGNFSSISGGAEAEAGGEFDWIAGGLFEEE